MNRRARRMFNGRARSAAVAALAMATLVVGILAARTAAQVRPAEGERATGSSAAALTDGREIVVVLIGMSNCGAAQRPEFPPAFERAVKRLREGADSRGERLSTIGVALDWDVADGLDFLTRVGRFDEVAAGLNWQNSLALRYIFRDFPGQPAVPQVVVLERTIEIQQTSLDARDERLLDRIVGVQPIIDWADGERLDYPPGR